LTFSKIKSTLEQTILCQTKDEEESIMNKFFFFFASFLFFISICYGQSEYSATYEVGPVMNVNRMGHFSVALPNGNVLLIGGHGTDFVSLNTMEVYNAATNTIALFTMNYIHDFGAVCKLADSSWLIAGGALNLGVAPGTNTAEIYYTTSNTFVPTGTMNYQRCGCTATLLANGKALIVGGWYSEGSATYGEVYDPVTHSFSVTGALNTPRSYPLAIPTQDSGAVVIGGYPIYGGDSYERVEYYNPTTNSFSIFSERLIPLDSGWELSSNAYNRPIEEQLTNDGKFLLGIMKRTNESVTEFGLALFDPIAKEFRRVSLDKPLPSSDSISFIGAPVVNKEQNIAYWFGVRPSSGPWQIELCVIDLTSLTWTLATPGYSSEYYWGSVGMNVTSNSKILVSGGTTRTDYYYNFSPVNNTTLVTPTKVSAVDDGTALPSSYMLSNNYPNPFNPTTKISFTLPTRGFVTLKIYNIEGKEIATIVSEELGSGKYERSWNGEGFPSGVYFCRLQANNFSETKKILLLK
jgi:hypothetical protein